MRKYNILLLAAMVSFGLSGCQTENTDTKLNEGMQALESMEYESALSTFETLITEKTNLKEAYRGLGITYIQLSRYSEAIDALQLSLSSGAPGAHTVDFDTNYYLAEAYSKNGDIEEAVQVYTAILDLKPKETNALLLRGELFLQLDKYEEAVSDYEELLAVAGNRIEVYVEACNSLIKGGYREEAVRYVGTVLANQSGFSVTEIGKLYYSVGEYETAKEYLEQQKQIGDEETILLLGMTYEALDSRAYAISLYDGFLVNNKDSVSINNRMAICKMGEEEYEEALTYINTALESATPDMQQVLLYNRIILYEYQGDFEMAKTLMADYLSIYPTDTDAVREYEFLKTR